MLLSPSTCTFFPVSLYVTPAEHGTQLAPSLDLTYPALQSLQEALLSAGTQPTNKKSQHPPRTVVAGPVEPPCRLGQQVVGVARRFVRAQGATGGDGVVGVRPSREDATHTLVGGSRLFVEPCIAPPAHQ